MVVGEALLVPVVLEGLGVTQVANLAHTRMVQREGLEQEEAVAPSSRAVVAALGCSCRLAVRGAQLLLMAAVVVEVDPLVMPTATAARGAEGQLARSSVMIPGAVGAPAAWLGARLRKWCQSDLPRATWCSGTPISHHQHRYPWQQQQCVGVATAGWSLQRPWSAAAPCGWSSAYTGDIRNRTMQYRAATSAGAGAAGASVE
jgi:hypothetical protein